MAKIPDKARQSFGELSAFVLRQEVADSLVRAAKDKSLLQKAKTDPTAFLKAEGHKLPPRTTAIIKQQRAAISGQITICVQVCRQFGRVMICAQVCITVVFQA